ncbi:hypothetical protein LB531_20945 [Mesorhizobium sp. CO1-1-2]|uniref:hypothetical protein n=1 Tax=Mesorhizobium sp. CO1-1-2 TaxID=2876635 RepID=UPI001CCB3BC1|nr:hypothetical protein [Mesorhizobium sp. CO1-1-2]MBZ9683129.1 hypothetical protein [Mesorhizobium sp. CO1-1-2]
MRVNVRSVIPEPFSLPDASDDPLAVLATASLIGFVSIRDHNDEIARENHSLGSGTLVRMPGDAFGVLTAAHVLDSLPRSGQLGYLTFNRQDSLRQAKIDAGLTKKFYAPGWAPGAGVPDLGFLQIFDPDTLSAMRAQGCSFYDLEREREIKGMTSNRAAWEYIATGVVAETRVEVPAGNGGPPRTGFTAIAGYCSQVTRLAEIHDFAVWSALVDIERHPTTYQGVSGGGMWIIAAPDGNVAEVQRFLRGVIFFESDANEHGVRVLRVHGLEDFERLLISQFGQPPQRVIQGGASERSC